VKLSLLTFNAGLLDINFFGIPIFKPAAFIKQRLHNIPAELIKTKADIISLQEVFLPKHQNYLVSMLHDQFPYHSFSKTPLFNLGSGLMIFSKYPIKNWSFKKYSEPGTLDEAIFITRGFISTEIEINRDIKFALYNTHLTSGGALFKSNHPKTIKIRSLQIKEILSFSEKSLPMDTFILGDFNSGPTISRINYEYILKQGFRDIYKEYCESNKKQENDTWDNGNPLHKNNTVSQSSRLDHIFFFSKNNHTEIINSKTTLSDNIVWINNNKRKVIPLSDHYGLQAILKIK